MTKLLICSLIPLFFAAFPVLGQGTMNIEGNWLGTLEAGNVKVRLIVKVVRSGDGFAAKLDSPDQGAKDLAVDTIGQTNRSVHFEANTYKMSYEGTLNDAGDEISGTFKQGAGSFPLVFKRVVGAAETGRKPRPQDPQKPYPYDEEEVSYENKADGNKLAGTLTLPRGGGQHPAVILITGSGAQDRDETILGHQPFLVLADYLTRRGIAVLRVDDRGVGGSTLGSPNATSENFAGDVLTGIQFLKGRKEINPKEIGLVGHSEGGMIAPMVAVRSKDVAFIVLLAGPGQTGAEIVLAENEHGLEKSGLSPEMIAQTMRSVRNILSAAKSGVDKKTAEQQIDEAFAKQLGEMTEAERKAFAPIERSVRSQTESMLSPWYRNFLAYDPRPNLEKVTIPVLALNGENDRQVPAAANLEAIRAALKAGKNKDYTIKAFPHLNHLFQTSDTGDTSEYGTIEETIAPVVLETIADWILKHTTRP